MTRNEALKIAKVNHEAHLKATIDHAFGRGPKVNELETFGYRHGWYAVGDYSFCQDEITGVPYDHTQGGWAYL